MKMKRIVAGLFRTLDRVVSHSYAAALAGSADG